MTPILMKILHKDYRCEPFEVALYAGVSKPNSRNAFFDDFIEEVLDLTDNGFIFNGKKYNFCLKAFVCDTPARAYVKNINGHTGFFACERCETEAETISLSKTNARKKKESTQNLMPNNVQNNLLINKVKVNITIQVKRHLFFV